MKNPVHLFLNNLTSTLRKKRELLNYSQIEIASKISTSLRTYQRIESGETEPTLSQVYKLSQILNFRIGDIFHFEDELCEDIKGISQSVKKMLIQEELIKSMQEIKDIQSFAGFGHWKFEIATNTFEWSHSMYDLLELDPQTNIPNFETFVELVHPEDKLLAISNYENSFLKSIPFEIEYRIIMPDGRIKWLFIKCKIDFGNEGNPIRTFGYSLDITDLKK